MALLVVTFTGDRIGGMFLKKLTEKSQFRYSRMYLGKAKADILLVGNSRGLVFYQPYIEEKTGKKTFNISYNGLPIDLAEVLIRDYYDLNGFPKKMVLEITMADLLNDKLISGFNSYTPYSHRLDSLLKTKVPKSYYGGKVSHLYRYNNEIFQRALFYLKKPDTDWLLDRVITGELKKALDEKFPGEVELPLPEYNLQKLTAIVQYAKSHHIDVSLVINPYYIPFANKIPNLQEVSARIEKATGVKVHNYYKAVPDENGFGDYRHLNKTGAKQYLDKLIMNGEL